MEKMTTNIDGWKMTLALLEEEERGDTPSASYIDSYILCPGKYNAEKGLKSYDTTYSDAGTRIHKYLAGDRETALSRSEIDLAHQCEEQANNVVRELFGGTIRDNMEELVEAPMYAIREKRLWWKERGEKKLSGQFDVVYLHPGKRTALILDYKTGYKDRRSSSSNWQLRALAVLLNENLAGMDKISVGVIQPTLTDIPEVCVYEPYDIIRSKEELAPILEKIKTSHERIPGIDQYENCAARHLCDKSLFKMQELALPANYQLSKERLSELLDQCSIAEDVIKQIRLKAKEHLKKGGEIPNYYLKKGAQQRIVPDAINAYATLKDIMTPAEFSSCIDVKIGLLEGVVKEKLNLTKKDAKETLNLLLSNNLVFENNDVSLKRT